MTVPDVVILPINEPAVTELPIQCPGRAVCGKCKSPVRHAVMCRRHRRLCVKSS